MPTARTDLHERHDQDLGTELGLLLLALIWGVNFSVIKVALAELSPLAFNALRFPVASLVLLALLRVWRGLEWPRRRDWPRIVALGLLAHVGYQVLFIIGIDRTTAGNASLLLATTPIWTLALSVWARHERPPNTVWAGVAGTATGVCILVFASGGSEVGWGNLPGDLLVLGSALAWSTYTVSARSLVHDYGPLAVTAWTLWVGTAGVVVIGLPDLAKTEISRVSPGGWLAVAYAGAFAISIAYALWNRGVHRIGNSRTAVYSNLVPVVALAVAWVWLGERVTPGQLVGAAIVLGSLYLTRSKRNSTPVPAARDA